MELGRRVVAERQQRGLTQAELARYSRISQATVSRVESGKVKELRPTHLAGLASCLGVTVDYLLGRTEEIQAEEILAVDKSSRDLVETYAKLTAKSRKQLTAIAKFLAEEGLEPIL